MHSSSAPQQPPDCPGGARGQAVTHTSGAIRAPRLGRGVGASWASPTGAPGPSSRPWRQQGVHRRAAEGTLWGAGGSPAGCGLGQGCRDFSQFRGLEAQGQGTGSRFLVKAIFLAC